MIEIDDDWEAFLECGNVDNCNTNILLSTDNNINDKKTPKCGEIYISTKTYISYLNQSVDLDEVFWKLKIMNYHTQKEGIVKKQMKFNSQNQNELDDIIKNVDNNINNKQLVEQYIITQIINPEGRIKFKDIRKISIGLCKRDILSYRCKQKSAFYNCFVIIMRIQIANNNYKEIHVKVFNTGKLEIPGIQTDETLNKVLNILTKNILKPVIDDSIDYIAEKSETVLINSNFNCGFYINREELFNILKYKYKINSAYDPCSYPGIQCEFYHDSNKSEQDGRQPEEITEYVKKISFMIFRTGSVLIVGKCSESILYQIYEYIKKILIAEYDTIGGKNNDTYTKNRATKQQKIRKKIIYIDSLN